MNGIRFRKRDNGYVGTLSWRPLCFRKGILVKGALGKSAFCKRLLGASLGENQVSEAKRRTVGRPANTAKASGGHSQSLVRGLTLLEYLAASP
ncbi:hypothetical protein HSBAA_62690 [Vreelandella sulfidaeris]|uniref:Uncharacterized protein n=1 Tax=Vreelandella sulfidaeris TaxID=115553 RepID=A0A455UHU0_9GAMM|nr:hypothetical protein HSBAA_62690 [Halomonas sulfidaeris]